MNSVEDAIEDFRANTPNYFAYPSVKTYNFNEDDKKMIQDYMDTLQHKPEYVYIRDFIGRLACDRINEKGVGIPILEWFD